MDYQQWCKEVDEQIKVEKEQYNHEKCVAKEKHNKAIQEYKEKYGNYWYYDSADVYIPIEVLSIPALDGGNTVSLLLNYGREYHIVTTELYCHIKPYTIEEYHNIFCEFINNKWIYKI